MTLREIADNTGLSPRSAELARAREFDEPFYFTSADEKGIARFVKAASERCFDTRRGQTFWHLSSGCDTARAVRTISQLFREATHIKLNLVGIGGGEQDMRWLPAMNHAILLPESRESLKSAKSPEASPSRTKAIVTAELPGTAGWNKTILDIIG
jgi:predicted mannosyl-3-phosphoglycerate phosphatase (HAD superfamily)